MAWKYIHCVALFTSALVLAQYLYEILGSGNLMLPARAAPTPASGEDVLFFAVWLASATATALRALWFEWHAA